MVYREFFHYIFVIWRNLEPFRCVLWLFLPLSRSFIPQETFNGQSKQFSGLLTVDYRARDLFQERKVGLFILFEARYYPRTFSPWHACMGSISKMALSYLPIRAEAHVTETFTYNIWSPPPLLRTYTSCTRNLIISLPHNLTFFLLLFFAIYRRKVFYRYVGYSWNLRYVTGNRRKQSFYSLFRRPLTFYRRKRGKTFIARFILDPENLWPWNNSVDLVYSFSLHLISSVFFFTFDNYYKDARITILPIKKNMRIFDLLR